MGSAIGAITGATGVGKKAKRGMEDAGDKAQYKPWDVTGSYFGNADFDYEENTANYNLSPELIKLRDMFMNQALGGVDQKSIAEGQGIKDKGLSMFTDAFNRDVSATASDYLTDMQDLVQPGRAKNEQRLANNLFASGRMGQGTAVRYSILSGFKYPPPS